MGGGTSSPAPVGSTERINVDPAYAGQIKGATNDLVSQTNQYSTQAGQAAGKINTDFGTGPTLQNDFSTYAPQLTTNFQAQGGLDDRSQALLAQSAQAEKAKLGTQLSSISRQFSNQPGVLNILQQQAKNRAALNTNPLLAQVAEQQAQRQQQEQLLGNQALLQNAQQGAAAQQLSNQSLLQGAEAKANLQNAGNAAIGQQSNLYAQIPTAQQNLLATLAGLGTLFGSRQSAPEGSAYYGQVSGQAAPVVPGASSAPAPSVGKPGTTGIDPNGKHYAYNSQGMKYYTT